MNKINSKGFIVDLKIKKMQPEAKMPNYAYTGDAGMDLFCVGSHTLKSGQALNIPTGVAMEIPAGYVGLIWDKSGLAAKHGLTCLAGVIDSGYRGEIVATILNTSEIDYEFKTGDKVCQILIQPVVQPKIEVVDELSDSERGAKKHGSSGK